MKTNASPKTVVQAVENVSKRLYEGNVVFRKTPEKMTKNVVRFTVKTLDANKKGSLVTKQGVKQTKADWNVHQDIMREVLRLDPRPHIYVDTVYGREHNKMGQHVTVSNLDPTEKNQLEAVESVQETQDSAEKQDSNTRKRNGKRKTKAQQTTSNSDEQVLNIVRAIKMIIQNPSILNERM